MRFAKRKPSKRERPNIRAKSANLTDSRIDSLLEVALRSSEWFETVPNHFSYLGHEKDDHVLNLASESKSRYLVTWENRLQKLMVDRSPAAERFRWLAPDLSIVSPADLAAVLNVKR